MKKEKIQNKLNNLKEEIKQYKMSIIRLNDLLNDNISDILKVNILKEINRVNNMLDYCNNRHDQLLNKLKNA